MTKLSRFKLDPKHLGFFLNNFWSLITLLENKTEVRDFLKALLTHTEMKMLAKRIQISKMLVDGYSYGEIRKYVKVTDPTIAKISNILATNGDGLLAAVRHLQKIEKDIDKERMSITPDLKKRYPTYFLPEILIEETTKKIKKRRKKLSAKESL
ncbi:MAG: hypothetical protein COU25_01255 [Candidatus Levybacteria bacterium CG10_big_fil_rev_8_21_14_0_10_35_13]|nr:MAG: hypothetical protein COU25_01255 [Candidatus Levybacteria bacterium CG10_big_fil_rev_8_21_14_0_10_35_13]